MSIVLKSVDFEWPNGHVVFKNLNLSLEASQKYGLVGPNGLGKSTLAKLIQGELEPTTGKIQANCHVSYFAQFETPPNTSVAEYLSDLWVNVTPADTEVVGRLQEKLDFESSCLALSGGEWTKARLLKLMSSGADWMILDEPTNHLDRKGRESVLEFVRRTTKGILVISHDRELLGAVSSILELSIHGIRVYGGNWEDYESEREVERSRLRHDLENAENERDRAQQERARKLDAQAIRMGKANRASPQSGLPKILLGARKRAAERTLGKLQATSRVVVDEKVEAARVAYSSLKIDQAIYADFPETFLPAGKLVFEAFDLNFQYEGSSQKLWKENLSFSIKGASRVSIVGENGSGKTTLLNLITGQDLPPGSLSGSLKLGGVKYGFIDQKAKILDPKKTVFENAYESSQKSIIEIRNLLAQFLFSGKKADQTVSTLSGGERVRAALAKVMISDPAPQLLILDEPTNNLDRVNLEFLEGALSQFQGAMIVVSHDVTFLSKIGVTDFLKIDLF